MMWDVILGGVTGLLGTVITTITNFKTQKLKNEHDQAMASLEIQKLAAKTDAAIKITEAKISGAVELADAEAYTKSQEVGNVKAVSDGWIEKLLNMTGPMSWVSIPCGLILVILLGFVDVLKGLMRPGLTLYLTLITSWLTYNAYNLLNSVGTSLTTQQAISIYDQVTTIVIYLTVSCITWWFGDRRTAKFLMRMDDGNFKKGVVNVPRGTVPKK